jgi:hypothetical protein
VTFDRSPEADSESLETDMSFTLLGNLCSVPVQVRFGVQDEPEHERKSEKVEE